MFEEGIANLDKENWTYYHYEQGSFKPIAKVANGNLYYILSDNSGLPKDIFNDKGYLLTDYRHKLWGKIA